MGNKRQNKKNREKFADINATEKQDLNASLDFFRDIEIQAAGQMVEGLFSKPSTFSIKAYDGGVVHVCGWWYGVVIDLQGLTADSQIPILSDHFRSVEYVAGQSDSVDIGDNDINVSGKLYSNVEEAVAKIVAKAQSGYKWQASVGVKPSRVDEVMEDGEVTVNGQTFQGPLFVARESVLKETSIVVFGAAENTDVNITAKNSIKEAIMPKETKAVPTKAVEPEVVSSPEENPTTPIQATAVAPVVTPVAPIEATEAEKAVEVIRKATGNEMNRINAINALTCKDPEIKAKAINDGISAIEAELLFIRAERPQAPAVITGNVEAGNAKVIEAKALLSCGMHEDVLAKSFNEQTMDIALTGRRSSSIKAFIQACCNAEGITCPQISASPEEWVNAGFSTQSLSGILGNIANKFLKIPFGKNGDFASVLRACKEYSLNDLKENTMYRMQTGKKLPEVPGGGPVELDSLTESDSTIQAKTHGKRIGLTRKMMINDDMNAFAMLPQKLGIDAHDEFTDQFVTLIETTAVASFFAGGNGNVDTSTAGVNVAGYTIMQTLFAAMTDDNDKQIGARPVAVIMPSALSPAAQQMFISTNLFRSGMNETGSADVIQGDGNPFQNNYEVIQIAKLTEAAVWYGLTDPARISAFNVGFLNGQRNPFVDTAVAGADSELLGKFFRIIWDFGFALGDTQGAVLMTDA